MQTGWFKQKVGFIVFLFGFASRTDTFPFWVCKKTDTLVPKSESVAADVASVQFQLASCLAAAPARLFESTRKWRKWISSIDKKISFSEFKALLARQIQCLLHTSSARTCVQLNSQESVCPTEFPSARSTKYKYYYYYNIVSCIQNKYTQRRKILHCSCLGCESSLPVLSGLSLHGFPSTQNKFFRFEN